MNLLTIVLASLILSIAYANSTSSETASSIVKSGKVQQLERLLEWFRHRGGIINPKVDIRLSDPNDPTSFGGMFALEDIEKDEVLIEMPPPSYISLVHELLWEANSFCLVPAYVEKERLKGNESEYAPYIDYLYSQTPNISPIFWSHNGTQALKKLLDSESFAPLPPELEPPVWLDKEHCKDYYTTETYRMAGEQLMERGWDSVMLPVFDMINHDNGANSVDLRNLFGGGVIEAYAKRKIKKGEQLYYSYNDSLEGAYNDGMYGTPELFRDFAFVERDHQRWYFPQFNIAALITGSQVEYTSSEDVSRDVLDIFYRYAVHHHKRLNGLRFERSYIPAHEYELLSDYHSALFRALKTIVKDYEKYFEDEDYEEEVAADEDYDEDYTEEVMYEVNVEEE